MDTITVTITVNDLNEAPEGNRRADRRDKRCWNGTALRTSRSMATADRRADSSPTTAMDPDETVADDSTIMMGLDGDDAEQVP